MSHIIRKDGRYVYRRRFPADVVGIVGRSEFRKALGTADRTEAVKLARRVSVEFDRICDEALRGKSDGSAQPASEQRSPAQDAAAILSQLQAVVEQAQRSAIEAVHPAQRVSATWRSELAWRKEALQAIADGSHPGAQDYNPLEAMAALRALERLERGEVPRSPAQVVEAVALTEQPIRSSAGRTTAKQFADALDGYCSRVSSGRGTIIRRLAAQVLTWPATPDEQVQRILSYAEQKLAAGGKATSVHTQAAGLITVLREMPGWEGVKLPRNDATARAVRKGGQLQRDARDAMPVAVVRKVLAKLDERSDKVNTVAARLLVTYGLRPLELMQEGPEALRERTDIFDKTELVFEAGLSGAKNSASRRSLPVHADDVPLFKLVLNARGKEGEATARARIRRLSAAVRKILEDEPGNMTLYSLRHTCADLLRAAGATKEEVGGVLGHTASGSKATSVYGGKAELDRPRELLARVRERLDREPGSSTPPA
jgi:integrase